MQQAGDCLLSVKDRYCGLGVFAQHPMGNLIAYLVLADRECENIHGGIDVGLLHEREAVHVSP